MIRPLTTDDAEELAALHAANAEFLAPTTPDPRLHPVDAEAQRARLEQLAAEAEAGTRYTFAILDGRELAGTISIVEIMRGVSESAVVGRRARSRSGRSGCTGSRRGRRSTTTRRSASCRLAED